MASVPYSGTAKEPTCQISAHLVKVYKSYAKNSIFYMKMALPMAISRKGSDQFQNPFFGLVPDMGATSVPNFKSIGPFL
jgi:hypothetical protein